MKKVRKLEVGKGIKKLSYQDQHSLGETHDMLVKALKGQSYLKETMHKINTSQVTGEALKKVSVGGKGGMGSQGDVRDQVKEVEVGTRVMVLCDPSQAVFDANALLKKSVKRFGIVDGRNVVEYYYAGEPASMDYYVPSHLFGDNKNIKGLTTFTKELGRDFDEFSHSNDLDPADSQATREAMVQSQLLYGLPLFEIERSRASYDYLCGYKDAWKHCRDEHKWDGDKWVYDKEVKARRYTISIHNTLNWETKEDKGDVFMGNAWMWDQEMSHQSHQGNFPSYQDGMSFRSIEFMLKQFDEMKTYVEQTRVCDVPCFPARKSIKAVDVVMSSYYEEVRLDIAKMTEGVYDDLSLVYGKEKSKVGKVMNLEVVRQTGERNFNRREGRSIKRNYYKNVLR